VSRTAADLILARTVAQEYRAIARAIEQEVRSPKLKMMPLTRRILGRYAEIARNAAINEELDSDPLPRQCSICGGTNVCLALT